MFDYFVRGEGIHVFPKLVTALVDGSPPLARVGSLTHRHESRAVQTETMSLSPVLDNNPPVNWCLAMPILAAKVSDLRRSSPGGTLDSGLIEYLTSTGVLDRKRRPAETAPALQLNRPVATITPKATPQVAWLSPHSIGAQAARRAVESELTADPRWRRQPRRQKIDKNPDLC